jgi:hypothetical protein
LQGSCIVQDADGKVFSAFTSTLVPVTA